MAAGAGRAALVGDVEHRWRSDIEIPADRLILYSAYATGRDPDVWSEPERFDPTRWLPGAPEPPPYAVVPFGGAASASPSPLAIK